MQSPWFIANTDLFLIYMSGLPEATSCGSTCIRTSDPDVCLPGRVGEQWPGHGKTPKAFAWTCFISLIIIFYGSVRVT